MTNSNHQFRINTPETLAKAKLILENLDLSIQWDFNLKPYKKNRSADQNSLYHAWKKIIADELGYSQDELHDLIKDKWVAAILERDDEEFKEQIQIARKLYLEGKQEAAMRLAELLKKRVSTTWLNTKQFSEMMNNLEIFASDHGIPLPQPPEKQ